MDEHLARSWKLVIALVAVLGMYAFFRPFYELHGRDRSPLALSAFRMLAGFDRVEDVGIDHLGLVPSTVDTQFARTQLASFNAVMRSSSVTEIEQTNRLPDLTGKTNLVPYYFLATLLLASVAIYSLVERRLGNVGALLAMLGGLISVAAVARSWRLIGSNDNLELSDGAYLLGLSGALALIAGFAALIGDDPGGIFRTVPVDDETDTDALDATDETD